MLVMFKLELRAILRVSHPVSREDHPFTGRDGANDSQRGLRRAVSGRLHAQDGVAGVSIAEGHALYRALDRLDGVRVVGKRLQFPGVGDQFSSADRRSGKQRQSAASAPTAIQRRMDWEFISSLVH